MKIFSHEYEAGTWHLSRRCKVKAQRVSLCIHRMPIDYFITIMDGQRMKEERKLDIENEPIIALCLTLCNNYGWFRDLVLIVNESLIDL